MGLLNSHQLLPGARKAGNYVGSKTYALAGLTDKPTTAVDGTTASQLNLGSTGVVEIEGKKYPIDGGTNRPNTFDFAGISTLLVSGRDYLLGIVPKYIEPTSRSAAEALNPPVNYSVSITSNSEFLLSYFLPSDVEAAVIAVGGLPALQKRVFLGTASTSDINVYNYYSDEVLKLSDPRFTGKLLPIVGYEFVVAEVYDQNNQGLPDVTNKAGFTVNDFNTLKATQGHIPVQRKVMLESAAATAYNSRLWKVASAKRYSTDKTNALADVSGTPITISGTPFNSGATTIYVEIQEYYFPTFMPEGHVGTELGISNFLTKEKASVLGRINPIYLDNPYKVHRTQMAPNPRPALTLYGDPVALTRVTATISSGAVTLTKVADLFEMLIGG